MPRRPPLTAQLRASHIFAAFHLGVKSTSQCSFAEILSSMRICCVYNQKPHVNQSNMLTNQAGEWYADGIPNPSIYADECWRFFFLGDAEDDTFDPLPAFSI